METAAGPAFVLEDLTRCRLVDQMVGLDDADTELVVEALVELSRRPRSRPRRRTHHVRSNTASAFTDPALTTGVGAARRTSTTPVRSAAGATGFADRGVCRVRRGRSCATAILAPTTSPFASRSAMSRRRSCSIGSRSPSRSGKRTLRGYSPPAWTPERRRRVERTRRDDVRTRHGPCGRRVLARYRTALVLPGLAVLLLGRNVGRQGGWPSSST